MNALEKIAFPSVLNSDLRGVIRDWQLYGFVTHSQASHLEGNYVYAGDGDTCFHKHMSCNETTEKQNDRCHRALVTASCGVRAANVRINRHKHCRNFFG